MRKAKTGPTLAEARGRLEVATSQLSEAVALETGVRARPLGWLILAGAFCLGVTAAVDRRSPSAPEGV